MCTSSSTIDTCTCLQLRVGISTHVTIWLLGNFACVVFVCFFVCLFFLQKLFQKYNQSVKLIGPRSGPTHQVQPIGPDLGPDCLYILTSTKNASLIITDFLAMIKEMNSEVLLLYVEVGRCWKMTLI